MTTILDQDREQSGVSTNPHSAENKAINCAAGVMFASLLSRAGWKLALTPMLCLALIQQATAGSWLNVASLAPGNVQNMILLSDGTVMAQNQGGTNWYRLTPSSTGGYTNGTWSTIAPMHDTRTFFSTVVLKDGRVFAAGGEYGTGGATAEIYDPVANSWTSVNPPAGLLDPASNQKFLDSSSEILNDGRVLLYPINPGANGTLIYDPVANTWTGGPTPIDNREASWVKLPDDSILTIGSVSVQSSARYIPSTVGGIGSWVSDTSLPIDLYAHISCCYPEIGPAFLLSNGNVIYMGGTSSTAIYTPSGSSSPGTWAVGPNFPAGLSMADSPGAMMPNGKILCALAGVPFMSGTNLVFPTPTSYYEYDPAANSFSQVGSPTGGLTENISSYLNTMLVLPDGTVLHSDYRNQLHVYVPDGSPLAAGKPIVNTIQWKGDGSLHLTGKRLNGISEGASFGDDLQMNSNYPLVRFTDGSGNVYYGRTTNWSSTGVMTGTNIVSTDFSLPPSLPAGSYLQVVANGIASDPIAFYPSDTPTVGLVFPTNGAFLSDSAAPQIGGYADDTNSTIDVVRVALSRNSDGVWYDFVSSGWGTTTFDFNRNVLNASDVLHSGHTGWLATLPVLPAGNYTVQAQSVNLFNNASPWKSVAFTIEAPPVITFSPLVNQQVVFNFDQLGGTVNETSTMKFTIEWFRAAGNMFWNGVNWTSVASEPGVLLAANLSGLNWTPAPGTLPPRLQLAQANYLIHVYATNSVGDGGYNDLVLQRSPLDTTLPVVTLDTIHNGDVLTNQSLPGLFGSALDNESGIASVAVYLNRFTGGDILYWNGSGWSSSPSGLTASYNAQTVAWQVNASLPSGANLPNGHYQVQVSAVNNEAPSGIKLLSVSFTVDYHPIYVWTAGSFADGDPYNNNNNWSDPLNWDVLSVPSDDADVVINGGSPDATSMGSVPVHGLRLSNATLTIPGLLVTKLNILPGGSFNGGAVTLRTNGIFNWTGGVLAGTCTVPVGAVMNVSNLDQKVLADYALLINGGTINWLGGGMIIGNGYYASSFITNLPGAIFQATADGPMFGHSYGNLLVFVNAGGLFAKIAGNGTNSVDDSRFINTGVVRCDSGVLSFNAQLDLNAGGTFGGVSTNRVIGGTATVTGLTTISNGVLELTGGTFTGAGDNSGTFGTVGSGKLVWSGGTLVNTLTLSVNAHTEISGPDTKAFADFAVLNNDGQITWLNGTILANGYNGPSYLRNRAGATFTVAGSNMAVHAYGNLGQFENQPGAALVVNTTGESLWNGWLFINDGILSGVAGRLNLAQGGASTGMFTHLPGSEVAFTGGTFLLHGGTRFNGVGTTRIAGATLTADGPATSGGSSFQLDSGVLNGIGFVTSGQFYWNGGTIGGTCSNALGGVFTMTGSNVMVLADSAVFNNKGTAQLLNSPIIANGYNDGATWNNLAGSLFNIASDGGVLGHFYGNLLVFNNFAGARFAKTAGTNSVLDSGVLNNSGELGCDTGFLSYATTINLNPGGTFTGAGQHAITGGTVTWIGTNTAQNTSLNFSNGAVVCLSNATIVAASPSLFDWKGGTLYGAMTLPSGSSVRLSGAGDRVLGDSAVFNNAGTVLFTGTGRLMANGYNDGATWNNLAGSHFNFATDGSILGHFYGNPLVFNNFAGARLAKTVGTNSTVDSTILNNSGELRCDSGTFTYNTTLNLNPGGTFTGAGQHTIIGGTVAWLGTNTVQNSSLNFNGGTVVGVSNATIVAASPSLFDWTGGTLYGAMTLPSGSSVRLSGAGDRVLADSTVFNNAGTALFTGTGRLMANGYNDVGTWNNLAGSHFNFATDGSVLGHFYGNPLVFNNLAGARLAKTVGTNTTVDSTILNNSGELGCDSGTFTFNTALNLNPGGTFTGAGQQMLAGGTVTLTGTNTVLSPVLSLTGANLVGGAGAAIATAGGSLLDWSGGSVSGTLATLTGSTIQLSGAGNKVMADSAVLNNAGTVRFAGTGPLLANAYSAGATISNQPGGVILVVTNATLGRSYGAGCLFNNAGSIFLSNAPSLFQTDWNYVQTPSGVLGLVLAGTNSGTTYSRFAGNSVTLDGSLAVTLGGGFIPQPPNIFDVLTFATRTGQFATTQFPSLPASSHWQFAYNPGALELQVLPSNAFQSSTIFNGAFQFNFVGQTGSSCLIEVSTNLFNWTPLLTNTPFNGTLNFADPQSAQIPKRYYRATIFP